MSLSIYNKKRNFEATAEPIGEKKKSTKKLIFVVQKHAASHLHYDFRLEMDGVLKSWAVPKGPSMNSGEKRLAMMVEDHPYDYKDFEGNIPKGHYGAGNVIVWDNGTYIMAEDEQPTKKALLEGLQKGHLSLVLKGKKLKGAFSLIRLKGKQENAWLLLKKEDQFASKADILRNDKSVLTKMTLEELEKKNELTTASPEEEKKTSIRYKSKEEKIRFIPPMLAETSEKSFNRKNWFFEIKYDGYRTIATVEKKAVQLFSRNKLSFNTQFESIAADLKQLPHDVVLDGEVVIEENGQSNFQLLQSFQKTKKGILKYYVFDILNLDGHDTTALTLRERKELLKILLNKQNLKTVHFAEHVEESGIAFFEHAIQQNFEGIIAKDANSPYRVGRRSSEWLKLKITKNDEAVIVGYTEPKGSRNYFGALVLAQYKGKTWQYIGNCGTGFNESTLKSLFAKFGSLQQSESALNEKIKLTSKVQWLRPELVCQVKFTEWTQNQHLRHPVFLGLRVDKDAKSVAFGFKLGEKKNHSISQQVEKEVLILNNNRDLKIGKVLLHLTNQNKVYFPKEGITKGDILNYYEVVADYILPHLKNRPQSMNRFPNGIDSASFYQKDVDLAKSPTWLQTHAVVSESNHKTINYLLCNDKATLLYMVNLGCIEFNPWNSTIKNMQKPDWVVIDLDPEKDDFKEVVQAALTVKSIMDELETNCYCKTSGATGLHIYIPLNAKYNYDTVKIFAELIANEVHSRLPDTTSLERTVSKRNHKIYIDFLQNRAGQTLASAYSVRPKNGATVSTPLEWDEVNFKLSPSQFTISNIPERLSLKGDLWKPVLGKGANLEKIIKKLAASG